MNYKAAYFIGIGGAGMSALARYLNKEGLSVRGYDKVKTRLTRVMEVICWRVEPRPPRHIIHERMGRIFFEMPLSRA